MFIERPLLFSNQLILKKKKNFLEWITVLTVWGTSSPTNSLLPQCYTVVDDLLVPSTTMVKCNWFGWLSGSGNIPPHTTFFLAPNLFCVFKIPTYPWSAVVGLISRVDARVIASVNPLELLVPQMQPDVFHGFKVNVL